LQPEIVALTRALRNAGRFVTIETAGTVHRPVEADLMSISPKRANSTPADGPWKGRHEERRDRSDVVARMIREYHYQLKYVVDRPEDVADVDRHVRQLDGIHPSRVYLMPQGVERAALREKMEWVREAAAGRGYSVSPRLHIEMFGNTRGT
jgi:7-carboxy-7-deazaguanine synthase